MRKPDNVTHITDHKLRVKLARLEERQRGDAEKQKWKSKEVNRRLDELNHAGRTRDARDQHFVSIDKFDGMSREFQNFKEATNKTLHELEGRTAGMGAARSNLFQVISVSLVAGGLIVAVIVALAGLAGWV